MQKISLINKLILKIQQILRSYDLNDHACFWPHTCKYNWNNLQLSWMAPACKKIISLHLFILEIQSILKSHTDHTQIFSCPPKFFLDQLLICEFVSTGKKSDYINYLFWRYGWLKNPPMWCAQNILVYISGPNMRFVQEHSK